MALPPPPASRVPPSPEGSDQTVYAIERLGGLGDVIMALSAVAALRALDAHAIILFHTEPRYAELVTHSPHVDRVFTSGTEFNVAIQEYTRKNHFVSQHRLNGIAYGINKLHQVDAFLEALGLHAFPEHKSAVVAWPSKVMAQSRTKIQAALAGRPGRRIILHPANGDRNRKWSAAHWNALADRIIQSGDTPVLTGDDSAVPFKGILKLAPRPQMVDLTNRLSLPDLMALCQACDAFVSPDSGPVQVAGLTDIGIVGIYSTVPARCRLPFRHGQFGWRALGLVGDCPKAGCYHLFLKDGPEQQGLQDAIHQDLLHPGCQATNQFMGEYCPNQQDPYCCLEQVGPDRVWEACRRVADLDLASLAATRGRWQAAMDTRTWAEAIPALEQHLALFPTADITFRLALAQHHAGHHAKALELLMESLAKGPTAEGLNLLGLLTFAWGNHLEAESHFASAHRWMAPFAPAAANLALLEARTCLKEGRFSEGFSALAEFGRIRGNLTEPWLSHVLPPGEAELIRGYLVLGVSSGDTALKAFISAYMEKPTSHEAAFGLGEALRQKGNQEEAGKWYRTALKLAPDFQPAQERLAALEG
ncbi:MAG TPA: hypothetical protein DHV93_07715 [Holophagaceae bacterium]|nr:hypothetical protein [Holophagaceae bacterium]